MTKTETELVHLFRALKAPAAARALPKLAERARGEEWSYERFAEALLSTEISSRESSGGRIRIRAARFSAHRRQRSVPEPSSSCRQTPFSIGPPVTMIAGTSADAAPISMAGVVLSQPESSTTASSG